MKNGQHGGLVTLYERFRDYELSSQIEDLQIAGVSAWPLVRFSVFSNGLLPQLMDIGEAHPDLKSRKTLRKSARGAFARLRSLKDRLLYSPSFSCRSYDILFALTPRQMRLADGREVAQMLDFFMADLGCSAAVLESRKPGEGYPFRPNWQKTFHLDGYAERLRSFIRSRRDVAEDAKAFSGKVVAELRMLFGVDLDVEKLSRAVARAVCLQLFYGPLFQHWLRRLKVKCVVTVVNYSTLNQVLCSSAHLEGIPVVELQHGTVYPAHPAYNLVRINGCYAPDYLFAWGPYWAEQTRNYALRKILCLGYPALEYWLRNNPPRQKNGPRKVVFISQGTIGAELSRRAVELRELLPMERFEIVYKLHPNETDAWRELYPWLLDSGIEVVSSLNTSIYELFQDASATVGVYSTAVIEGLMWNLKGYVFGNLPGGDTMVPFLQEGVLENVPSSEVLARCLERETGEHEHKVDGSWFWQPHAVANIVAALHKIVETGEVQ